MTYRISRQADADVEGICNYIARDDPAAADRLDKKNIKQLNCWRNFQAWGTRFPLERGFCDNSYTKKNLTNTKHLLYFPRQSIQVNS
jgi:hypothetical protein